MEYLRSSRHFFYCAALQHGSITSLPIASGFSRLSFPTTVTIAKLPFRGLSRVSHLTSVVDSRALRLSRPSAYRIKSSLEFLSCPSQSTPSQVRICDACPESLRNRPITRHILPSSSPSISRLFTFVIITYFPLPRSLLFEPTCLPFQDGICLPNH